MTIREHEMEAAYRAWVYTVLRIWMMIGLGTIGVMIWVKL